MNILYIYHHLGLGDHIIANGLVNYYSTLYDRTYLFCKPNNIKNVSYMYRHNNKIKFIIMDDKDTRNFINFNKQNKYLIIGHEEFWKIFNNPLNKKTIDEIFYEQGNIPLDYKWDKFEFIRNIDEEDKVYNELISNNKEYIFVHDDNSRPISKLNSNLKIIKPNNLNIKIFDYLKVIENAKEVHCINSSFFCLLDCININNSNLYLHEYTRTSTYTPILKCQWNIIK